MFNSEEIVSFNNNWVALVFIIILLILVGLNSFYGKRLARTNRMLLTKSYIQTYYNKDKIKFFNTFSSLLFIVQILSISLLLYLFILAFNSKLIGVNIVFFLNIVSIITAYFVLRYLVGFLLSNLFDLKDLFFKLSFEKSNYLYNVILWVLPMILLSTYAVVYKLTIVKLTVIFSLILLVFRYVLVLLNNKKVILNNLFYFILYLCTLEIAPLIIILKLTI